MAQEVYRIEIPILVDDQSEAPLERARERVSRFEKEARRRNEMIRKHFEKVAKLRIEPVMRIRDKLTAGVLKADKLVKMLGAEQAAPVLTAQDRISAVVLRINQLLEAMEKNRVDVMVDLKGPLMDEINEARAALVALSKIQAAPVAELRGKLYAQLTRAMMVARRLDQMIVEPKAILRERILAKTTEITAALRGLTSRVWTVTLQAKDRVANTVRHVTGLLTSPLTLLGAGAGLTAAFVYPLKIAGEMDRARNAVLNYSASVKEGSKNFEELVAFALKSPVYDIPFVTQMGGRLLAMTKDINFTKRALEVFGNSMFYTGSSLDDVKLAFRGFQQIASKGRLQMEELYQVIENLNIPLEWVQEELGITGDQLSNLGRVGIPARRAMEGILKVLEKHFPKPDFGTDLLALTSQVKETARTVVWFFGRGMAPAVIRILQDVTRMLDPTSEKFRRFQEKVMASGKKAGDYLMRTYGEVKRFWSRLSEDPAFQKADVLEKILILLEQGVPRIAEVGARIGTALGKGIAKGLTSAILNNPWTALVFGTLAGLYTPGPIWLKAVIVASIAAAPWVKKFLEWVVAGGEAVGRHIPGTEAYVEARIAEQKRAWEWFEKQKKMTPKDEPIRKGQTIGPARRAAGGIFAQPHLALVAEAGPEAIIPFSVRMRSRALALWEETGRRLGVLPGPAGRAVYHSISPRLEMRPVFAAAFAPAFASSVPISVPVATPTMQAAPAGGERPINIYLDGAVRGTFYVSGNEGVEDLVKKITSKVTSELANGLRAAFNNMPRK